MNILMMCNSNGKCILFEVVWDDYIDNLVEFIMVDCFVDIYLVSILMC